MAKATGPNFVVPFKRRRQNKTNYYKRFTMLKSHKNRLVIRSSNKNIILQIIEFNNKGDKVLKSVFSKELRKFGWYPKANTPTAYLAGLLLAKKYPSKDELILDIGMARPTKGRILFAAALGAKEGGLKLNIQDSLVEKERIDGSHISKYAKQLEEQNPEKFKRVFSDYLKNNFDVKNISSIFYEVKKKIQQVS
ncbi:MAG: 50S ribosomal protein L18 [Candidatus Micrarchaeota archaeon]|nr:50S ribosomal protein L18 [Candidatus Micrarchaeota archaeon]